MLDLQVRGMGQLEKIAKLCNEAGDKTIRREVTKAMKAATEPAKQAAREAARTQLPRAGGLNERVAAAKYTTRTSLKGRSPSVRLSGKVTGYDLRAIDRGQLRHPVFGNRKVWVSQDVPEGFWTKTMQRRALKTRRDVIFAMEDVARMVTRGI